VLYFLPTYMEILRLSYLMKAQNDHIFIVSLGKGRTMSAWFARKATRPCHQHVGAEASPASLSQPDSKHINPAPPPPLFFALSSDLFILIISCQSFY
jgi:hypothetical protein